MRKLFIIISSVLIAAHFLRSGSILLVALCLAMPLLLLSQKRWSARLLQGFLVLAGSEWVRTLWSIALERRDQDRPWIRMAVILGSVAVVTFIAAWLARPRETATSVKDCSK